MVDNVGKFIAKHFPEAKVGAKIEDTQKDTLKHTIFVHSDANKNNVLEENEVKNIDNSEILEGEERKNFLSKETVNLGGEKEQLVDKVILLKTDNPKAIVSLKQQDEKDTPNLLIYDVSDKEKPINIEHRYFDDKNVEIIEKFNTDGTKTIKHGNTTINIDTKERVSSIKLDEGAKGITEVQYEYEGDNNVPKKEITINPEGTKTEKTENIENPNVEKAPEDAENAQAEPPKAKEEDTKTQVDRTKPLYAKKGESFLATAKRIFGDENLTKEDPRYKTLAAANPRAAQKGWFVLSKEIQVPEGIKDKVADEAFTVDKAEQERAYLNFAKEKVQDKIEEFKKNSEETTLNKSTSWWMLAKKNLKNTGIQNPTNKQIYERIGVLTLLNEGKEPVAGAKLLMPKVKDVSKPTTSNQTETTETNPKQPEAKFPESDSNPPVKDSNPPEKDSTPPKNADNLPQKDLNVPKENEKNAKGKEIKTLNNDGSYREYEYDNNGHTTRIISRDPNGEVRMYFEYEYSPTNGKAIKQVDRKANGEVEKYYEFIYDDKGNSIKDITRRPDGSVEVYYEHIYNDKNELVREIIRNPDGTIQYYYNMDEVRDNGVSLYRDADGKIIPDEQETDSKEVQPKTETKNKEQKTQTEVTQEKPKVQQSLVSQLKEILPDDKIKQINIPKEQVEKWRKLNIPDIIIMAGENSVKQYAKDHNIKLD